MGHGLVAAVRHSDAVAVVAHALFSAAAAAAAAFVVEEGTKYRAAGCH